MSIAPVPSSPRNPGLSQPASRAPRNRQELLAIAFLGFSLAGLAPVASTAAPASQWIPAAAHAAGSGGSVWRTDLSVRNTCSTVAIGEIRFSSAAAFRVIPLSVAPGAQLVLDDVVARVIDGDAVGALEIVTDQPVTVGSRTYNVASTGTYGQELGGVSVGDGIEAGESATLPQLREDSTFRSNLGILNLGPTEALVSVRLLETDGTEVGAYDLIVPGRRLVQENRPFATRFGRSDIASGSATVTVKRGSSLFAYASVVDNRTGDPTTIAMDKGTLQPLGSEERSIAERLINSLGIPATAAIFLAGPVEPRSKVRDSTGGDPSITLTVPSSGGPFWVAQVDENPARLWKHPVRWVVFNATTGATIVRETTSRLVVVPPSRPPAPFVPRSRGQVGAVNVWRFQGEGALPVLDVSHKDGTDAESSPAVMELSPISPNRMPISRALVFDAGDGRAFDDRARVMSDGAAEPVTEWLQSEGFSVERRSQWRNNAHRYIKTEAALLQLISDEGVNFTALGRPDGGECDNYFLYMIGHGDHTGLEFYSPAGSLVGDIFYLSVLGAFESFPDWVKVTIFVDSCESGGLRDESNTATLGTLQWLCSRLCALTILTSVDESTPAQVPYELIEDWYAINSATQDFIDGADEDFDGDGKVGDIRDRFENMRREAFDNQPTPDPFHCPDDKSWCVLDGSNITKTACDGISDQAYQLGAIDLIDPAGHSAFIGNPFHQPVRFTFESGDAAAQGAPPFVPVNGATLEGVVLGNGGCGLIARGEGIVAGFPGVEVLMEGTFDAAGAFSGIYVMGSDGGLPGGESITYVLAGPPALCPNR